MAHVMDRQRRKRDHHQDGQTHLHPQPLATSTPTATRTSTRARTSPHHLRDYVHGADLNSDSLGLLPLADYNQSDLSDLLNNSSQYIQEGGCRPCRDGEKVWLASDVKRTSPVPYSDVDTTRAGPSTSTVRAPRAQSTKRQGRSMETSDGTVISEARLGTIPYMVVWMLLLYTILAFQVNGTLALSDHDKQVISYDCGNPSGIQAYDAGEQNHWCDLNPFLGDTNTDITITNVSYVATESAEGAD
jgi:hypothetical protein